MKKSINQIKKNIKIKYKHATYFEKNYITSFQKSRNLFLSNIEKNDKKNISIKFNDSTFLKLKEIYSKKKFTSKLILPFYKKFEINLQLKKKYDKNNKKISNCETTSYSYVFLGLLIYNCKALNKLQKLNCILKINDCIILKLNNSNILFYQEIHKLFNIEKNLISKLNHD